MHTLDHKGQFLKVRGPLNIARPPQGWPVIVQASASDAGRQLAAETAEVIFAAGGSLADGKRFYADIKSRMTKLGRSPEHLKVLPGALVIVGDTVDEARQKRRCSTASFIPTAGLPRCRLRSAATLPASISTDHCRRSLNPTRARAGASGSSRWPGATISPCASSHRSPAVTAVLVSSARRRRSPTRWSNGCSRRVATASTSCSHMFLGARRLCRQGGSRIAAAGPVPTRIRGRDAQGESRFAAAGESIFQGVEGSARGRAGAP